MKKSTKALLALRVVVILVGAVRYGGQQIESDVSQLLRQLNLGRILQTEHTAFDSSEQEHFFSLEYVYRQLRMDLRLNYPSTFGRTKDHLTRVGVLITLWHQ